MRKHGTLTASQITTKIEGLLAKTKSAELIAVRASINGDVEQAKLAAESAETSCKAIQAFTQGADKLSVEVKRKLEEAQLSMENALRKANSNWDRSGKQSTESSAPFNPFAEALKKLKKTSAENKATAEGLVSLLTQDFEAADPHVMTQMHKLIIPDSIVRKRMAQFDQLSDASAEKPDDRVGPLLAVSIEDGSTESHLVDDSVVRENIYLYDEEWVYLPANRSKAVAILEKKDELEDKALTDGDELIKHVEGLLEKAVIAQVLAATTATYAESDRHQKAALETCERIHSIKEKFTGVLSDDQYMKYNQLSAEALEAMCCAENCAAVDVDHDEDHLGVSKADAENLLAKINALKNKVTEAETKVLAPTHEHKGAYLRQVRAYYEKLCVVSNQFFDRYSDKQALLAALGKTKQDVLNRLYRDENAARAAMKSAFEHVKLKVPRTHSKLWRQKKQEQSAVTQADTESQQLVPLSSAQYNGPTHTVNINPAELEQMLNRFRDFVCGVPGRLTFNGARVMRIESDLTGKTVSGNQLAFQVVPYSTAVTLRFPRDDVIGVITPTGVGNNHGSRIGAKVLCAGAALGALYLVVTGYQYANGEADESRLSGAPYLPLPASNNTAGYELGEYGNGVVPFVGGDSFDQGKMLSGVVTALTAAATPVLRQTATIVSSTVSNLIEKTGLSETATRIGSGLWGVWKSKAPTWLGGQSTPVITDKTRLIAPPETAGVAEINPVVVSSPADVSEQIQLMPEIVNPDVGLALASAAASSEFLARLNRSVKQPSYQLTLYQQPFDFSASNITGGSVDGESKAEFSSADSFSKALTVVSSPVKAIGSISQTALDGAKNAGASVWRQLPSVSLPKISLRAIDPRAMLARASQAAQHPLALYRGKPNVDVLPLTTPAATSETANKNSVVSSTFSLARRPVAKVADNITWAINLGRDGIYASAEGVQGLFIRLTGTFGPGGFVDEGIQAVMPQQSDLPAINITDGVGQHPQVEEIDDVEIAPNATDAGGIEEEIDVESATHAEEQQSRFRQWQQWAYTSFTRENIERLNRDGALPGLYQLFMHNASSLGATGREILNSGVETAQSTWGLGAAGLAALFYMMRGKSQANVEVQAEDEEVEGEQKLPGRKGGLFSSVLPINSFRDNVKQAVQWLKGEYKDSSSDDICKYAHAFDVVNINFKDEDKKRQQAILSDDLGTVGREQLSTVGDNKVRFTLDKGSVSDQYQRFLFIAKVVAEECKSSGRDLKDEVILGNVQPPSAREECRQAFAKCGFQDIKFGEEVAEEADAPHVASAGF